MSKTDESCEISIIIGTFNRCDQLAIVLDSLLANKTGSFLGYEILVVDNNSNDRTADTVNDYIPRFDGKLRYLFEPNQGLNFARNRGIAEARGNIIAYTDDDVIVKDDWIVNIKEFFDKNDCDAVGGRILPIFPEHSPQWVKQYLNTLTGAILFHDYGEQTIEYNRSIMNQFVGANMAFKKEVFEECGGFNTDIGVGKGTMGAETEMFNRLKEKNKKIVYCGKIMLWHPVERRRMTLRFIAKWNKDLGKYFVVKEEGKVKPGIICYFGIPRYLFRRLAVNVFNLATSIFNMEYFIKNWVKLFRDIGMVIQYAKGVPS